MPDSCPRFLAAAVQSAPVLLDREATVAKTVRLIIEARASGAKLIVFPEAFIPGYPFWLWSERAGTIPGLEQKAFAALWREAIDVPGLVTERLGEAARAADAWVMIGVNERETAFGRATLYNTLLTFGPDGSLWSRHRKLVPTYRERTVWGQGDGTGLDIIPTPLGRISGLICWENYMPLVRFFAYAQGVQIHVGVTVDDSPSWQSLMRAIAAEGRVYVISACQYVTRAAFLETPVLSGLAHEGEALTNGGSMIVAPGGKVLAGPLYGEAGIVLCEVDLSRVIEEKHSLDVAGHYARPDLFQLTVNLAPQHPYSTRSRSKNPDVTA